MAKQISVLGIITARGGSKGIPRKNIADVCGKPLLAYTIEAAKGSKFLTRCILSTEDREIAEVGKRYGIEVPFMRPLDLAQDVSTSVDVVKHAANWIRDTEAKEYDYIMILQPTSPLRTAEDIDACIELAQRTGADSVMSMYELVDMAIKKLKAIDSDGKILPLVLDEGKFSSRRQDLEKIYKRNAAIYLTKTALIMEGDLFGKDARAYVMPESRSIDIHKPFDLELAEFLIKKHHSAV